MENRPTIENLTAIESLANQKADPALSGNRRLTFIVKWMLIPSSLAVLVLGLTGMFRESTSETFDESIYVVLGISVFKLGNFTNLASPMCPPLPILIEYWLPGLLARSFPKTPEWDWEVPSLIRQARLLTSVFIGLPLVWLVYGWIARRRGWIVGALGGALMALSPTVLAASSLATTDACFALFALVALLSIRKYQKNPSRATFILMGLGLGLALAAKQSAVILFPVALVEVVLKFPGRKPEATWVDFLLRNLFVGSVRLASLVILALMMDWACYGFGLAPKFGSLGMNTQIPVIAPMVANMLGHHDEIMSVVREMRPPLAIDTLLGQMTHASLGHYAFLMGQRSFTGWWYFFPVALAIKSTPAELLLFGLTFVLAALPQTWRDPTRRIWLSTLIVLIVAGMRSSINIGHRYMLLCYPLIILMGIDWLGTLKARRPFRSAILGGILLAWQVVSLSGIAPHYLAYFNGLCGGPSQGYRYLVDSSLDWGQDLPSLRRFLEEKQYRKVAICLFGQARPEVYGIRAVDWMASEAEVAGCDWIAISATSYQGPYGRPIDYDRHPGLLPTTQVGYSIFLYDLKNEQVRAAWKATRAAMYPEFKTPGLKPDEI